MKIIILLELCRIFRDYFQSFGKGCRIIRRAEFFRRNTVYVLCVAQVEHSFCSSSYVCSDLFTNCFDTRGGKSRYSLNTYYTDHIARSTLSSLPLLSTLGVAQVEHCFCSSSYVCSELFTNCLDMLCSLLSNLNPDFHMSLAMSSDEGKKPYSNCIKKLKAELSGAKSYCVDEIQQLFPLSQRMFTVTTVKQPSSVTRGQVSTERINVCGSLCCN